MPIYIDKAEALEFLIAGRGGVAADYAAVLFLWFQCLSDAPFSLLRYSETTTFLPTLIILLMAVPTRFELASLLRDRQAC